MLLPCKLCNANDRIVVSLDETKNEARAEKTVFSRVTTRLVRLESTHDSIQYRELRTTVAMSSQHQASRTIRQLTVN